MKTDHNHPPSAFIEVQHQINTWRESRTTRGRMPRELWSAAVSLAKEHGIWKTAQILRLSYDSLKKQLIKSDGASASRATGAKTAHGSGFMQMEASQLLGGETPSETVVEISTKDGAKLTMRLAAGNALDISALVTAFRQRVR